jgi:hypothetical protein
VASVKPNGHKKHRESQGVLKVNSISAGVKWGRRPPHPWSIYQPVRQLGSSGWAGSSDFQRTHPAQPLASTGCLASSQFEFEFKKPTCFPGDLAPKHCYPLTFLFIHHRYNTFHINWMHIKFTTTLTTSITSCALRTQHNYATIALEVHSTTPLSL